jgi:hypothetical protein
VLRLLALAGLIWAGQAAAQAPSPVWQPPPAAWAVDAAPPGPQPQPVQDIRQVGASLPPGQAGLVRTAYQPMDKGQLLPDVREIPIQLTPPGPEQLFGHLESEDALQKRMKEEAKERVPPERITFPDEPQLTGEKYRGREWPQRCVFAEPNYVCYGRLYFEQKNFERYGWDLDMLSIFLSTGAFYKDVALFPYHWGTDPFRCAECSAGYCLPGDPVPLLLYPCELSLTGTFTQAAVITSLLAIFP